ncbi:MAG: hypothetical protein CL840_04360 [Crocinitomicaceae bacterium]|nr:hypothetical protein [Crocinitomicaceae bacterium]
MPFHTSRHGLTVQSHRVSPQEAYSLLESPWQELQCIQHTKFFLSWQWIGQWLISLPKDIKVNTFAVYRNSVLVAVAAVPERCRKSIFGRVKQGYLNRTGEDELDQVWIENNKVLTTLVGAVDIASIYEVIIETAKLDELMIMVMSGDDYVNATEFKLLNSKYNVEVEYEENGYYLPIHHDINVEKKYSKSLKRQLKQTVNAASSLGMNLRFEVINDSIHMIQLLEASEFWHIAKWDGTSTPSGFTNTHFKNFHKALISQTGSSACGRRVRMFALWDGDALLGILYGLQEGDWFGFYLSSIKPMDDNRLRLGLYMHHMAIHAMSACGVLVYDFMAGEARYKKQFGSLCMSYGKMKIQRKRLSIQSENWLKRMKMLLKNKS